MQMSTDGTIVLDCGAGVVDAGHVRSSQQADRRDGESAEK